jgi:hypothetical protein
MSSLFQFKYKCFAKKRNRRFYRFVVTKPGTKVCSVVARVFDFSQQEVLVKVDFSRFFLLSSSCNGASGLAFSSDRRTQLFCLTYLTGIAHLPPKTKEI